MATSLQSEHYGFGMYGPADKTSYLTNYNNLVAAIDAVCYAIQQSATTANTIAAQAKGLAERNEQWINDHETEFGQLVEDVDALQGQMTAAERAIQLINTAIDTIPKIYTGALSVGETTFTFTVPELDNVHNFFINPFCSDNGITITIDNVDVTNKAVTVSVPVQTEIIYVAIEVIRA